MNVRNFVPFLGGRSFAGTDEPGSPKMPAAGGASPRKSGQRGRNMPPLSLPNPEELLVETGVDHSGPLTNDSMLGTPTSAREIRARPIDVDKEIPLLFVDDGDPSGGLTPSSSNAELHGSIPASRQDSRGGLSGGGLAGASSTLIVNSSHGALGGISLATALAGNPNAIAIAKAESLAADINIPKCEPDPNYEAPPAARRFRLPVGFLQYKPHPSHERIIEYELDNLADLALYLGFDRDTEAAQWECVPLPPLPFVLVAASSHPLAAGPAGADERAHFAEVVVRDSSSVFADAPKPSYLGSHNVVVLSDFHAKRVALLEGAGFGWMPAHLVRDDLEAGTLAVLDAELARWTYAPVRIARRGRSGARGARLFLDTLQAALADVQEF